MPALLRVLLLATGTWSVCPAQTAAEREPNDRPTLAQRLDADAHVAGTLASTADVDWYAFTLREPRRVQVRIVAATLPWQPPRQGLVALYDAAGHERLAWNERADGQHNDCGLTLPAGDYTCLVAMQPIGSPGAYELVLQAAPPRAIDVHEAPEPNDDPALGGAPTPFALGATLGGAIDAPGDSDWWTFELDAPALAQVLCLDDGGPPQLDDTRLRFWSESAPGLWSPLGAPGHTRHSHRVLVVAPTVELPAANLLPPGRYAVQVDADTPTPVGTAPWDYRKVGRYALRTAVIPLPGHGPRAEADEPNDEAKTATAIVLGDDAHGSIAGDGDADWYRFRIAAPAIVAATAEGRGDEPLSIASVRLWSAAGVALASGTGSPTAHGRLVHTLTEPGAYFLEVRGRLFADRGDYVLHTGTATPLHQGPDGPSPASTAARPAEAATERAESSRAHDARGADRPL